MSKIALKALLDKAEGENVGSESFETKAIKVSITSKPLIPGLVSKGRGLRPPRLPRGRFRGTSQRFAVRENSSSKN